MTEDLSFYRGSKDWIKATFPRDLDLFAWLENAALIYNLNLSDEEYR